VQTSKITAGSPQTPDEIVATKSPEQSPSALTEGVEVIKARVTANTIYRQRDQALGQPAAITFDGDAQNIVMECARRADIFGTAVRMIRKSRSQEDTGQQKLKSVALFIYLTGVQLVTDIRQHHLDMFGHGSKSKSQKITGNRSRIRT